MVMVDDSLPPSFWKSEPSVNWIWLPTTLAVTSAPVMPSPPASVALTLLIEMEFGAV